MGQYNTPNTPDPGGINGFAARAAGRIYVGVGECPRLHLHVIAYILGSFMRMLAVLKAAEPWSPTSLREKLIKIGARSSPRPLRHLPAGRRRGVAADVQGYPDAHRPVAGAARTSVRGAGIGCDRRQRQRCALTKAKRRVSAP
jgi:hypothetical protein